MRRRLFLFFVLGLLAASSVVLTRTIVNQIQNTRLQNRLERETDRAFTILHTTCAAKLTFQEHTRSGIIQEIKSLFDNSTDYDRHDRTLEATLSGVDAWNQPLQYVRDHQGNTIVWSVGPNGVDENGNGDDIRRVIWSPP